MEPVIGLDVAKGASVFQAFVKRNEVCGKSVTIRHTEEGFGRLGEVIRTLEEQTGNRAVVVLEATGHYHRIVIAYLERMEITHFIVNPLLSKRSKSAQLRKVKTDAADAWHLAEMYYRGDVKPHRTWNECYTELQHITRQHEFVTSLYVQAKLNMRALLDQVFPTYEGVFSDLFSATALTTLQMCLSDQTLEWDEAIRKQASKSRSASWICTKIEHLEFIYRQWKENKNSPTQMQMLKSMVSLLLSMQEQIEVIEDQIRQLAGELPEVELIKSIPGIGDKLAAAIISEIGDAQQFQDPKQLVAFAGLDPGVHSSGQFVATSSRITKRGSKRLRRALFLAVQCGLRRDANAKLKAYYDKKRKEGKPYKVTVIACANKLLHHIYAILKKGQPYQP
ncbi:MAG: IS110 family transposase [Candidatus Cohnella colombiensis]|uniref:IS110 family transposase n=1 Tax=Candidatus Cohnella colombiensis TaxID=3121368 RepID=A0AA95EW44_9BACL|nr:MAG: IS110 family transposase [Cohnella sp.]WEK54026.1 MAG: IS110 family transposase [Cohnella sp.]WEK54124.1 MAG: IS110 family transposase [Cohnella sp.]WEK55001.1 MAG: IS110 family transposase [Cohnella sp.]WEK55103.1 MAG: IS110 family transposase [Cohnella sp.]